MEGEGSPEKTEDAQARDAPEPQGSGRSTRKITKLSGVAVGREGQKRVPRLSSVLEKWEQRSQPRHMGVECAHEHEPQHVSIPASLGEPHGSFLKMLIPRLGPANVSCLSSPGDSNESGLRTAAPGRYFSHLNRQTNKSCEDVVYL